MSDQQHATDDADRDGRLEIGGVVAESLAVCDGARVNLRPVGEETLGVSVSARDGLATVRLHVSAGEADELADRLREQAAELRARTEADE
jgi:hypothetical protein